MLNVIDANLFSSVIDNTNDFGPLLRCCIEGNGVVVYGGTKYSNEIAHHNKFRRLLVELAKIKKALRLDKDQIDHNETFLASNFKNTKFNDHHILAIVILSATDIVCAVDHGLHALINRCYLTKSRQQIMNYCYHPGHLKKPNIYQNKGHIGLLINYFYLFVTYIKPFLLFS